MSFGWNQGYSRAASNNTRELANQNFIGENYKDIIAWMKKDLNHYLANFDSLFEAKLERIRRHQKERLNDLQKPHGYVETYLDSADFINKFVGSKSKVLRTMPSGDESRLMNVPGEKTLYVDTWAVPFFNTGTQSREQAKLGVAKALEKLRAVDLNGPISVQQFTEYMALFARPEFDDLRRYKLNPFPTVGELERFGLERSDAKTFGDRYPLEDFIASNGKVEIDYLSYLYGHKKHFLGLISHAEEQKADGRIFTGPADFLEHDFAHAFFNLSPMVPGTVEDWRPVHEEFIAMLNNEVIFQKKIMMRLVYFHLTHESGFKSLIPNAKGEVDIAAYNNELYLIKELLHTRNYYDWILNSDDVDDNYESHLQVAFFQISVFFKDHFFRISKNCVGLLSATSNATSGLTL